jgi:very-short-patch-repair endonuclease
MPNGVSAGVTESPFEREVMTALVDRGLVVDSQVGIAGYRIDLGVRDAEIPGRYVCGIECDGVAYHSSETARDRDRLRQQVLEARGWTLLRVWSTDWFKDRGGQIDRIVKLVDEARRVAREAAARPEPPVVTSAAVTPRADPATTAAPESDTRRHAATDYVFAKGEGRYAGRELVSEPPGVLAQAIGDVVEVESPVHIDDVITRVAAMWDTRAGTRIQSRIVDACALAERQHLIERRGEFLWNPGHETTVRSRAGTRISAERIAPEEFHAAVRLVLDGGRAFARPALINEVRALLGFSRTGAALDEAIGNVVSAMLSEGVLGEGSTGLRLR